MTGKIRTTYYFAHPGMPTTTHHVDWPAEPDYLTLAGLLDPIFGAHQWEHVWYLNEGERHSMFVHERGHVLELAHNPVATEHYQRLALTRGVDPKTLPTVVGPAVIVSRRVWY